MTDPWNHAHNLKLAFRCMQSTGRDIKPVIAKCRKSRIERKKIIYDLTTHVYYPLIKVFK